MAYKTDGPRAHTRGLITEECKSVLAERATRKAPPSQTEDGAPEKPKPVLAKGADLVVQERQLCLVVVLGAGLLDLGLSLIQLGLA